jgi:hypothetical protein
VPTPLVHAALAALIACGGEASAPAAPLPPPRAASTPLVAQALEACESYRGMGPEPYGRCLVGRAPALTTVGEVEDLCGRAGPAEPACREAWVGPRRVEGTLPVEEELRACGANADCALQSLERHPAADIHVQLRRCRAHAPAHVDYCLGHALRRWVRTSPGQDEAAGVLRLGDSGMLAGRMLGRWSACQGQGLGMCPTGRSPGEDNCRGAAEAIRTRRETCEDEGRRE